MKCCDRFALLGRRAPASERPGLSGTAHQRPVLQHGPILPLLLPMSLLLQQLPRPTPHRRSCCCCCSLRHHPMCPRVAQLDHAERSAQAAAKAHVAPQAAIWRPPTHRTPPQQRHRATSFWRSMATQWLLHRGRQPSGMTQRSTSTCPAPCITAVVRNLSWAVLRDLSRTALWCSTIGNKIFVNTVRYLMLPICGNVTPFQYLVTVVRAW
jgi:hypothetical protein